MNTILISGTCKTVPVKVSRTTTGFKVVYNVNIWASLENTQLQFITYKDNVLLCGHGDLWQLAKDVVSNYFKEEKIRDGAYTQYLEHLIPS